MQQSNAVRKASLLAAARKGRSPESFYSGNGQRVGRVSSDSVWPLQFSQGAPCAPPSPRVPLVETLKRTPNSLWV